MSLHGERAVWIGLSVVLVAAIVVAVASLKREEREVEVGYEMRWPKDVVVASR